ncbi:hypothetical protein JVT61DRAFT_3187 [Boletus reticuloceps]|uniref:Uncharacterized protein n=1 Tax=Boletus reticuloceps TaxID=495285 RepID=A0A8I2YN08_9AGAM|nr:hypothetical protein JVT61DRAFT_3187 [Boletus reticuloceps]
MVAPQTPRLPAKPRQSLRERCQVSLAIIPISYREWNKVYDCNCELVFVFEDEEEEKQKKGKKDDQASRTLTPSPTPSLTEESHLVEIMDGLYIALVDDEADLHALHTFDDEPFTHVVQVSYSTPYWDDPLSLSNWRREEAPRNAPVQRLDLVCPTVSLHLCAEQTAVGPKELHAAREFLSLALPHGSTKWWPEKLRKDASGKWSERDARDVGKEQDDDDDANVQIVYLAPDCGLDELLNEQSGHVEQDDNVNVLIVAPTSRAVDVLSVLFCYLAFLEDTTPDDLVETDYFDQVWDRVTLGRWSMCYVELIAWCDQLD